ncbi:MAG TPA: protease pro-enzyme activation domain-containing protein [Streptosporangiaceae bacterium]
MSRLRALVATMGATAVVVGTMAAAATGSAQASPKPATTVLAGSTAPFTSHTRVTGRVAGSEQLTVELWLAPEHLTAATSFATSVSTPGSARFHRYLSPSAYTARFGASRAEAGRVESWLRGQGFTAVHPDAQLSYVRANATAATVDAAFHTTMSTYQSSAAVNAGQFTLRANSTPVTLPSSLAPSVLGLTGLDNAAVIEPMIKASRSAPRAGTSTAPPCSNYYGQNMASGLPTKYGVTSFPTIICGYSGAQMREAYGMSDAATGQGQTIALVEQGLTRDMFETLQDYAKVNGVPAPSAQRYEQLSLGQDTCGDPFNGEEQLDVEISYDMAPAANQLVVGGDSCNSGDEGLQALANADIAVLDGASGHPLATAASNSWESGTEQQPASWTNIEHAYLVRAAGEGVGMYFSAGDGSGVLEPSIDPFAIAVGGTTLGLGASGDRLFETGWSDGANVIKNGRWNLKEEEGASGGGPSIKFAQPAYQKGIVPASLGTTRSAPDIAANADPFTGMALGALTFSKTAPPVYSQFPIGGTSESSPLVAGVVIAAQQGEKTPFGFINPSIYALNGTDAFFPTLPLTVHSPSLYRGVECDIAIFANLCGNPPVQTLMTFDDQNPHMRFYTGQVTLPGYDNMTGLGTPDGPNFIAGLRTFEG